MRRSGGNVEMEHKKWAEMRKRGGNEKIEHKKKVGADEKRWKR